jgi:hypothetical protein
MNLTICDVCHKRIEDSELPHGTECHVSNGEKQVALRITPVQWGLYPARDLCLEHLKEAVLSYVLYLDECMAYRDEQVK